MTNVERIHAGQEGLEKIQGGVDKMQVALEKAEQVAIVADERSHCLRRILLIVAVLGLIGVAIAVARSRSAESSDEPPTDVP